MPRAAAIGSTTEILVAHSAGRPVPLGLDSPLPLLGGGALAPDGLPLAPGLDHFPDFRSFVATACRDQVRAGRPWYQHPPAALIGAAGAGRGLAARWLARETGLPLFALDARSFGCGADAEGLCLAMPDPPTIAIATSRCANPILLVSIPDEPLPVAIERRLADLADPRTAGRRHLPSLGAIFDLGHVSWIFQGRHLPPALAEVADRGGGVIAAPRPVSGSANLLAVAAAREICIEHGAGRELFEAVLDEVTATPSHAVTCGELCDAARAAAARVLRNAR